MFAPDRVTELEQENSRMYAELSTLRAELDRVRGALQEIADCKIFNSHDPADCTDDVFEWGSAIVRTAREALDTKEVGGE